MDYEDILAEEEMRLNLAEGLYEERCGHPQQSRGRMIRGKFVRFCEQPTCPMGYPSDYPHLSCEFHL